MKIYLAYDTYDNELFVTRGTANAVAKVLDVHPYKVRDYARIGSLINRRYRVILERDEEDANEQSTTIPRRN